MEEIVKTAKLFRTSEIQIDTIKPKIMILKFTWYNDTILKKATGLCP
ncbi:MAG: hypothetical protein WBF38_01330 [Nitrosotalea sp.]